MPVITIRGHSGSFTSEIARQLAQRLGAHVMDRQVLHEAARRLQVSVEEVEEMEKVPVTLRERMLEVLGRLLQGPGVMVPGEIGMAGFAAYYNYLPLQTDTSSYVEALEKVVHDLATDDSVVFTSKGTQIMLQQQESAFHVFITAPLEERVRRIMERNNVDAAEAQAMVARIDGQRKVYLKRYFKVDLEDFGLYDIVLNTGKIGVEAAVDTILRLSQDARYATAAIQQVES